MEEIILKAINLLDEKYKLPKEGFLAGGALANTINKLIFGGKVVINDIDIYKKHYCSSQDFHDNELKNSFFIKKKFEPCTDMNNINYNHMSRKINKSDYMELHRITNDGIFNNIEYFSNNTDYNFLLETFDINACCVGYDLENKKAYWTKDFEYYCKYKQLQVSLPNSPSHTAIRLLKKKEELNAFLDEKELQLLVDIQNNDIIGSKRYWFAEKYFHFYEKYKNTLSKYFTIISKEMNNKFGSYTLYRLYPLNTEFIIPQSTTYKLSNEWNLTYLHYTKNLNFNIDLYQYMNYYRTYKKDPNTEWLWKEVGLFFDNKNYLDGFDLYNLEKYKVDIINLSTILQQYNNSYLSLKEMTLLEQLEFMSWFKRLDKPEKYFKVLSIHKYPFTSKTFEDFELEINLYKIKYRYKIKNIGIYNNKF